MAAALHRLVARLRRWADPARDREVTDRQLLARFAADRDEAAFAELVRRHGPMVLGVARRVLRHSHDAEDVFQATFLVLARRAAAVGWQESAAGWLFPVAYHLALKCRAGRQRRRTHEAQVRTMAATESAPAPDDPLRAALEEELGRLPDHYRSVVVLCYLEGKTQREAAAQLGLSPGEVRGRLDRARQRLRQRLARRGLALTAAAATLIAQEASAAVPPALGENTARAAALFAARTTAAGLATVASAQAVTLARGALNTMLSAKLKSLILVMLALGVLGAAALLLPVAALGDDPARPAAADTDAKPAPDKPAPKPDDAKAPRRIILLWMSGGPSQFETFDLKPGNPNGGPFRDIETTAKGVRISEHLPNLAKQAKHLAIIRSLTHNEGDHARASFLMRTGRVPDGQTDYPTLGSLLAKELRDPKADLPPYVRIGPGLGRNLEAYGPGFLGEEFGPLLVGERTGFGAPGVGPGGAGFGGGGASGKADASPKLPPLEAFEKINKDRAEAMRKGVAKAFDLTQEKDALRDAYGRNTFGQGCLLARRLVENGVPVVEVALGGWDTHEGNFDGVKKLSEKLDPAWAMLLSDLQERKLLDSTLIVWMGEFGRTPKINNLNGRDHWPRSFSVVLAGAGVKGGQVIGKTSDDGLTIAEQPVTPAELHATILPALRIDPAKENMANGQAVPLVEKGAKPIKEALK